jgi:hypothetical protein
MHIHCTMLFLLIIASVLLLQGIVHFNESLINHTATLLQYYVLNGNKLILLYHNILARVQSVTIKFML